MNRVQVKYTISSYLLCALLVMIMLGSYAHKHVVVQSISCSIDPSIADAAAYAVAQQVNTCSPDTIDNVVSTLYQSYPWIKNIVCNHAMPGAVHLHIEAHAPYIRLNDIFMLKTGQIIPADIYVDDYYQNIYTMQLASNTCKLSPALYTFISSVPDDFFDRFTITWNNEHHVVFSDKQQPIYSIVGDASSSPFDFIMHVADHLDTIVHNIPSNKPMYIDCRFADQIIVYDAIRRIYG